MKLRRLRRAALFFSSSVSNSCRSELSDEFGIRSLVILAFGILQGEARENRRKKR
jgi:hypothetical protein